MGLINTFLDGEIKREQSELLQETQKGVQIANEGVNLANRANSQQRAQLREKDRNLSDLSARLMYAEQHVREYEALLCKPMLEIAQQNGNFKATYDAQMQIMADWMVSQKAFKELAIQFGFDKGLKHDQVIQMGNEKKLDVLDNKHKDGHGTNANDVDVLEDRVEATREKVLNKLNKTKTS